MTSTLFRVALALAAVFAHSALAHAQTPLDLLRSMRQGGGWLAIPVTQGSATLRTDTIPTLGLAVDGCLTVWPGHSGMWSLEAYDPLNDQALEAVARPGEGVRFSYQTGARSALGIDVRWSEPRDTVLQVWIGVDTGDPDRDACTPRYRGDGGAEEAIVAAPRSMFRNDAVRPPPRSARPPSLA
ncbi:MAG TPA: hypothetical protein VKA74_13135 [Myxococcota bacterium]|nr:hypothetical protein [Myxococcota bacterium]HKK94192.1 hypothetical protein [Longimicrobiales bacterium]